MARTHTTAPSLIAPIAADRPAILPEVRRALRAVSGDRGSPPEAGQAWDTFMSLAATSRKLGVNFLQYLHDRIVGANQIPSLATLIDERAQELALGASWSPA